MDGRDSGIRWSTHQFHAQLLPGTVPICVDVMEQFDAVRAARHERLRSAMRAAADRSVTAPIRCPNCDHDVIAATAVETSRPDPPAPAPTLPPALDPQRPLMLMTQVVEAIAGRRPVSQLAEVATPRVLGYVRVEAGRARSGLPPSLRTLHVQHVDSGTAELFGLVAVGPRLLAYCARLSLTARGWGMTELRLMRGPMADTGSARPRVPRPSRRRTRSSAVARVVSEVGRR